MINVEIKIIGPGLIVNAPAAIIQEALEKFGYTVDLVDFSGQHQLDDKDTWPTRELVWAHLKADDKKDVVVKIDVDPLPWGG